MLSKKYYQELLTHLANNKRDYTITIENYFDYIVESEINGNYSQVRELIKKLSNDQFKQFCNWFVGNNSGTTKDINWFVEKRL